MAAKEKTSRVQNVSGGDLAPVRIAMIDDDPSEHVLMEAAAREAGIPSEFTFYEDGADALLHLIGAPADDLPDVIVLDLRMPGLDGHSTLDELQADPVLWEIPVVVFTSSPRPSDVDDSVTRGAVSHVVKPSDFESMIGNVVDLCELARRGVRATRADEMTSGRAARRETVEQIGAIVDDYVAQLSIETAAITTDR